MNYVQSVGPTISTAVCIENDLSLTTYMKSVNLTTLGKYRFPMNVDLYWTLPIYVMSCHH